MKKVLQFSGLISLVLVVVAFILMMATPAIVHTAEGFGSKTITNLAGVNAIFGKGSDLSAAELLLFANSDGKIVLSATSLIGWILLLAGLVIVLCGVILPLLKINALEKFAGILNLVAVICFVLGGVFMFLTVPTLFGANGRDVADGSAIGAGWVIGGILAIVGGAFAILPAVMDFIGKKK